MTIYKAETRLYRVNSPDDEAIQVAAEVLRRGGLVAFPTETVYGLGANAFDKEAVSRIFSAKERPTSDPVIVHLHTRAQLEQVAIHVPELAHQLAGKFWPGPLTLVLQRSADVPSNVSAGRDTVAVRMPNHPVARAFLGAAGVPIAAPSANRFARPSATTAQHVWEDLGGRVDVILDGGPALIGLESTVLDLTVDIPTILRPGGVLVETLREIVPDLEVAAKYLNVGDVASAPGMLTRHYSPRAQLLLFTGSAALERMRQMAHQLVAEGKRVGILTPDDEREQFDRLDAQVTNLGVGLEQIGYNLFARIRELDASEVDVILVHGFQQRGLGMAIWDRLLRAANGQVIAT